MKEVCPGIGSSFRISLIVLFVLTAVLPLHLRAQYMPSDSGTTTGGRHGASSSKLYKMGEAAEQREDWDAAYTDYQQAYTKDPKNFRAREAMYRVRVNAASQHVTKGHELERAGDTQDALTEYLRAAEIDPGDEAATQAINSLRQRQVQGVPAAPPESAEQASVEHELESMGSPVELKPVSNEPLTLHMAEDSKVVYQAIGRAAGINVLFDPDYNSKRIQVDLQNSTLMDALRIVGVLSNTFWRPVTSNTIFVAQNSRSKRTELDESAVQTFYLNNAWQQNDLNDVQTALRNVLTSIKVYGLASQNALVVRGTPDELLLAQKLINDLDKARPEVVVDIAVMEVSKNWERNIGIQWPASASVALNAPTNTSTTCPTGSTTCTPGQPTTPTTGSGLTLYNLAHLNSNDFSVTVGAATANLLLTDSNTKILQNPRLRATDMQKATMKIGERIPIATGSYQTGAATALVSSLVNTQFQYIDVGVNIEITPTVHTDGDVTLKSKIEVTAQSGNVTISGVTEPIIAQKNTEETVRLREGEANILSGILNEQDQVSWSGIPGLSSIPILKYLFGAKDHTITNDEVVFMMVPHIVRGVDITNENLRAIDVGQGAQNVELRRIAVEGPGANTPPQIEPVTRSSIAPHAPAAPARPQVGTVPGSSAAGGAPAALEQLRQAANGNTPAPTVPQTNLGTQPPAKFPSETPPATPLTSAPPTQVQPAPRQAVPVPSAAPPAPQPPGAAAIKPNAPPASSVKLMMNAPAPVAAGSQFQIPVVITGAADIASVPLQVTYDPSKLSLVNVGAGDFLSRDGQAVALVHRDDGPGTITINASRPPGAAGVNGAGVVCMLSFVGKASGSSTVAITRPGAINSEQKPLPVQGSQVTVKVK